jgi:hypothetical protein
MVIDIDYKDSYKLNYHAITTTTAPCNMELNENNVIRKYVHEQGRICTHTSYLPVITYGFDAADYV